MEAKQFTNRAQQFSLFLQDGVKLNFQEALTTNFNKPSCPSYPTENAQRRSSLLRWRENYTSLNKWSAQES